MKHLAEAIVYAAAFLELSGDDVVDPDSAVKAMEDITSALVSCSPEETEAIRDAASRAAATTRSDEEREFFENFIEAFNVGGSDDDSE